MTHSARLSISFDQRGLDRLRDLAEKLSVTQRDIICGLLELPDDQIEQQVAAYRVKRKEARELRKQVSSTLRKSAKDLTPEQLSRIEEIIHGNA